MRGKIILNLSISLDGYIADSDDGYDWIQPSGDSKLNTKAVRKHEQFLEQVSAVVMGKRCYDLGMHTEYGGKQVYVVTSKKPEDYDNIHFIGGDVCRQVVELSKTTPGDIYLFGGGISIDSLLTAELIDEYIIGIIPIILGKGIKLFLEDNPTIPIHLTHYYVEDGVVRYIPRRTLGISRNILG